MAFLTLGLLRGLPGRASGHARGRRQDRVAGRVWTRPADRSGSRTTSTWQSRAQLTVAVEPTRNAWIVAASGSAAAAQRW